MTRLLALAAVLAISSDATAGLVRGNISGPVTDDGNDTYVISARNAFADDATSIALRIEGSFVNTFPVPFTFHDDPDGIAGFPDTFFVIPDGFAATDVLGADVEDTSTVLAGIYTVPGPTPFIPAGDASILAVVVVPEGTRFGRENIVQAQAAVAGAFRGIVIWTISDPTVPEPSTALLTCLALIGSARVARE